MRSIRTGSSTCVMYGVSKKKVFRPTRHLFSRYCFRVGRGDPFQSMSLLEYAASLHHCAVCGQERAISMPPEIVRKHNVREEEQPGRVRIASPFSKWIGGRAEIQIPVRNTTISTPTLLLTNRGSSRSCIELLKVFSTDAHPLLRFLAADDQVPYRSH